MQTLSETILEYDLNPFIVFGRDGKLIHYNREAEYLLSFVPSSSLYDLAINNASQNFGTKVSHVNLRYDRYSFCAILVGYLDEEKIGLKLYKEMINQDVNVAKGDSTIANIFTLLELSKNSVFANKDVLVSESLDPTIPEMKLHVKMFLKLLNRIFAEYADSKEVDICVSLKIGKTMIIKGKSYPICNVSISSNEVSLRNCNDLYTIASEANVIVIVKDNKTIVEFPIMT